MPADEKVLVYHYRADRKSPLSAKTVEIKETDLNQILTDNPKLQKTSKEIESGAKHVDIRHKDLLTEGQLEMTPAVYQEQNVAGVDVSAFRSGGYRKLYILSSSYDK